MLHAQVQMDSVYMSLIIHYQNMRRFKCRAEIKIRVKFFAFLQYYKVTDKAEMNKESA